MTCIVGIEGKSIGISHNIIMGDSIGVDNWSSSTILSTPKVFEVNGIKVGFTTSYRMAQILQYHVLPKININFSGLSLFEAHEKVVVDVIEPIRNTLKDLGFSKVELNEESGGEFLLGVGDYIFEVSDSYQVDHHSRGFSAVGIGYLYALATIETLKLVAEKKDVRFNILEAAEMAIQVASNLNTGVCMPVTYKMWEV